ncbi:MAG: DUF1311 domain-containing protein [Flavobacteriia bacterium]|nr:DUF1311 domain-containing protein [Flavobacteriia bacterium]
MKIILFPFFLCCFSLCWSQLEDAQLDSLKKEWTLQLKQQITELGIGEEEHEGWIDFSDSIYSMYAKDTFLLNGIYGLQVDADQTTSGMARAAYDCETGYDQLLNKYYGLLLSKLEKEEQTLLKESQRNWIKFRDSERKLSLNLMDEKYTGGGTIQRLVYSSWYASLTEKRVEELVEYLMRVWNEEGE